VGGPTLTCTNILPSTLFAPLLSSVIGLLLSVISGMSTGPGVGFTIGNKHELLQLEPVRPLGICQ
jgi:hypothetical protein